MLRILVSRCLLGEPVRFDGAAKPLSHPLLERWRAEGRLVPACPELLGGLGVPRPAAEIVGGAAEDVLRGRARVLTADGADVTATFLRGARKARQLAEAHGCRFALLKENSPSCGVHRVHDGSFSGQRMAGEGIASALLRAAGLRVFAEHEVETLARALVEAEAEAKSSHSA